VILRTLQGDSDPDLDLEMIDVRRGDRILVCSDGLSGIVRDPTIRDTLVANSDLADAADALVDLALKGGAPDNVTCVVADVVETDHPPAADDTAEAFLVGAASGDTVTMPERIRRGPAAAMRSLLGSADGRRAQDPDDAEALRYAPQPPRRYRWLRRLGVAAVVAALAWAGLNLADDYIRAQYYVGAQAGTVAIYRGVSQEVGPLRLSDVHEVASGLPVGSLPALVRDRVVTTIPAADLTDAEQIVENLRAEACRAHEPTPSPSPTTPSPTPTPGTTAGPTVPLTPSPQASSTAPSPAPLGAGTTASPTPTSTLTPTPVPSPSPSTTPGYPGLECRDSW
jgi:protein phosphatase